MKRLAIIVALSILPITGSMSLFSAPFVAAESDLYLRVESFTWEEFSDNGTRLLEESGPIFALGFSAMSNNKKGLTFKGKGELFGGVVDYDGQTQAGRPVQTDVNYLGVKIEGDLGWKFMVAEDVSLMPIGGLGWRGWSRDLNSTSDAIGYEELWSSFYARLGIRGEIVFSETMKVFAEGGAKLPIYNHNRVDIFDVTVEPGIEVSAFGEIGLKWKKLKASLFYEGMRFSRSDAVAGRGVIVYQPESKADIYGVSLGLAF